MKQRKNIQKAMNDIIESKSLISLDEEDFGGIKNVLDYFVFKVADENADFEPTFNQDTVKKTKKLVVNITSNGDSHLLFLEKVFCKLRDVFGANIEIMFGSNILNSEKAIKIEVFPLLM
jgi:cell division GTPase FtsZ